jgi:hypothetical protein
MLDLQVAASTSSEKLPCYRRRSVRSAEHFLGIGQRDEL